MSRSAFYGAGPAWKPRKCADCGAPFPSFNRDGGKEGTAWRCMSCDRTATRADIQQGNLL